MNEQDLAEHEPTNHNCPECWGQYPLKCLNCGSFIHSQVGDGTGSYEGSFYLECFCVGCGAAYKVEEA